MDSMDESADRYVTFRNIDCAGRAQSVVERLQPYIDASENPFWAYFRKQREAAHANGFDDLRVLHNYLPTLRELLSDAGDDDTLALLEALEVTCM
jgi:hypothetical protein